MNKEKIRKIIENLKQPSGWVGITGLITLMFYPLSGEQSDLLIGIGVGIASLISSFSDWE